MASNINFFDFKDVKIISEATQAVNPATLAGVSSGSAPINNQAGNRLIIAARRDDWLRIEKLIIGIVFVQ